MKKMSEYILGKIIANIESVSVFDWLTEWEAIMGLGSPTSSVEGQQKSQQLMLNFKLATV